MAEEKKRETTGEVIVEIRDLLQQILASLGGAENAVDWDHDHCRIATPGEPKQLSPMLIPDGMEVVVRALPGNTGDVYVGKSKDLVKNANRRIALEKKDHTRMRVQNTSLIWVDAEVATEGVDYWCEIKPKGT